MGQGCGIAHGDVHCAGSATVNGDVIVHLWMTSLSHVPTNLSSINLFKL